jgi:hypothetical protein
MGYKGYQEKHNVTLRIGIGTTLVLASSWFPANAQLRDDTARCPVFARLPADLKTDASADERLWFELSQCNGEPMIVKAFEGHKNPASLTVYTGYTYPALLNHIFNILVLESFGGTADHVLVITFHAGKPRIALRRSAGGPIQVKRLEKAVLVSVPPKTYPGPDGKFPSVPDDHYSFDIEY